MYEELINNLRERSKWNPITEAKLMIEAADAIEKLQKENENISQNFEVLRQTNKIQGETISIYKGLLPKWISVEKRLPEQKGFYLVFAHGVIGTAYYGPLWWTEDPRIYEPEITHWMPMLPEPPKEDT